MELTECAILPDIICNIRDLLLISTPFLPPGPGFIIGPRQVILTFVYKSSEGRGVDTPDSFMT